MKINISVTSLKYYDRKTIWQWVYMFKRYTYVRGFIIRVLGVYVNVREKDATAKLIEIFKKHNEERKHQKMIV